MSQRIVPFIGYEDAAGAIDWLGRAFGFVEDRSARYEEEGVITHAELDLEGATIYLSTPRDYASPRRLRDESEAARRAYDNPWVIDGHFVEVGDVEKHYERAVARGGDDPPGARGAGDRLSHLHGGGSRRAPLDVRAEAVSRGAYLLSLGLVPYGEAFALQRSLAGAVSQRAIPETVVFLEHPPVITVGKRTETERELHVPEGTQVEIAETDRGGKSTFHGPGQLVCYPILDLKNHGKDVKRYVRDLEEALIRTLAAFGLEGTRYEGLTGVWMPPEDGQGPRKIASIGVHVSRWVTTHGYALNVDLDPAPFTDWITACGLEDAAFTTMARELERPVTVEDVRPAAIAAIAEVFELELEELPAEAGAGLWQQPVHASLASR